MKRIRPCSPHLNEVNTPPITSKYEANTVPIASSDTTSWHWSPLSRNRFQRASHLDFNLPETGIVGKDACQPKAGFIPLTEREITMTKSSKLRYVPTSDDCRKVYFGKVRLGIITSKGYPGRTSHQFHPDHDIIMPHSPVFLSRGQLERHLEDICA